MPAVHITAMSVLSQQTGAHRILNGIKIPHPCGDPTLTSEADRDIRKEIVKAALNALQTEATTPTVFLPKNVKYVLG